MNLVNMRNEQKKLLTYQCPTSSEITASNVRCSSTIFSDPYKSVQLSCEICVYKITKQTDTIKNIDKRLGKISKVRIKKHNSLLVT